MNLRAILTIIVCTCTLSAGAQPTADSTQKEFDCPTLLKALTRQGIDRNVQLRNVTQNAIDELENQKGEVSLLASWVFRGEPTLVQIMRIPIEAQSAGVNVLVELSGPAPFQHPTLGAQSGILATFVFKATKDKLIPFLSSLRQKSELNLVAFEVLQTLPSRNATTFATFQAVSLADRPVVLAQAIRASAEQLILFNDVRSKSFLAMIDPHTYDNFLQATRRTPKIETVDEERLARSWNEFAPKVASGEMVLLIKEVNRPQAYVTTMNDLAEIQLLRVNQYLAYQKLVNVVGGAKSGVVSSSVSEAPTVVGDMVARPSQQFEFISITRSDFIVKRVAYFGPDGSYQLSAKRPIFQIRSRSTPEYVGFYPPWLKNARLDEVEPAFRRFAGLAANEPFPEGVRQLIANYRNAKNEKAANGFHVVSLSDVNPKSLTGLFKREQPMILTPGRRDKQLQPMSFILIPVDFEQR